MCPAKPLWSLAPRIAANYGLYMHTVSRKLLRIPKSEVFELISNRIDEYNFHLTNRELDCALFSGKHA